MLRVPSQITELHPDVLTAIHAAVAALESHGHNVEEAHPAALDEPEHILHFGVVTACDVAAALDRWSATIGKPITAGDVELNTWGLAELGRACPGPQLMTSREWLFAFARRMAAWWEDGFDLLLTPTLTAPPPPLGTWVATPDNPLAAGAASSFLVPFTPPFNATGQPAISLPISSSSDGLPIGVQLVAPYGREDLLLGVAAQMEGSVGWSTRRPAVS